MELDLNEKQKKHIAIYQGRGWIKMGLIWGTWLFVANLLIFDLLLSSDPITWKMELTTGFPIMIIAGLSISFVMKIAYKDQH